MFRDLTAILSPAAVVRLVLGWGAVLALLLAGPLLEPPVPALALALPAVIGRDGAYTAGREIPIIVLTLAPYAFFLVRQMGAQATDFREVYDAGPAPCAAASPEPPGPGSPARAVATGQPAGPWLREVVSAHRGELLARVLLLSVTARAARRVTALHGAAHLTVFAVYGISLFC